jgi:thioesterase domain-containing protein
VGWDSHWPSLVPIQTKGTKTPLFLIHGMDGGVFYFHNLATALGDDQPVYGLQAQGMDGNSLPLLTVEEMATLYLRELRGVQPEGPYQLAGYCFGAEIALQIVRKLRAAGQDVSFFAAIDKAIVRPELHLAPRAPAIRRQEGEAVHWHLKADGWQEWEAWLASVDCDDELSDKERLALREVWEKQGLNHGFEVFVTAMTLVQGQVKQNPALAASWAVWLQPWLPADVTSLHFADTALLSPLHQRIRDWLQGFLSGLEDPRVREECARWWYLLMLKEIPSLHDAYKPVEYEGDTRGHQAAHRFADWKNRIENPFRFFEGDLLLLQTRELSGDGEDPTRGWKECCTGEIDLTILPCNHDELFRDPHVQIMAQAIQTYLSKESET